MNIRTTLDPEVVARAQGCWLGQLTGDALGSMVEFQKDAELRRRYPEGLREIGPSPVWGTLAGQPTDDSELALVLARSLVRENSFQLEKVAEAYCWWRCSDPFDVGGTIGAATGAMRRAQAEGSSLVDAAHRHADPQSQANGALMRQSPLAIWGSSLPPEDLGRSVRADTALTHPHPVCGDASAAFVVALAATIKEGLDGEAAYGKACAWQEQYGAEPSVLDALRSARDQRPEYGAPTQGWVLVALQNAFFQALHAHNFEDGVVETVMGGGDTDTNAAIAGALLGAIFGVHAVPAQWREAVLSCRPEAGEPEVRRPRPEALWPGDALDLAEKLLITGA